MDHLFSGEDTLLIVGELDENASIGITKKNPGVFTDSTNVNYNDASKFFSDNTDYIIGKNTNGQLLIGAPITVTYHGNGATSGDIPTDSNSPYASGSSVTVLGQGDLSNTGYTFEGWNTQADGSGTSYTAGNTFTISGNTTLYAQWTLIPATAPTINSVSGADLNYDYTEGGVSVMATPADGHSITGYQWYSNTTNSNSGGTAISGATSESYAIPTGENAGTTAYYYCVVTAARTDNSQTATATSGVATVNIGKAPAPELTDAQKPTGKTGLVYTGEEQELVTAPTGSLPEGYAGIQYALGTDATTAPTTGYTTIIPNATDAGTYYVWYQVTGEDNHNDTPTACVTVTISKSSISPEVTLEGWVYGEETNTPSVSGNPGGGAVTYSYKEKDAEDSTYSETLPTAAGAYTVKAAIAETANYNGSEATADFTIAKADITPTVTLTGWTYGQEANTPSVSGNPGGGAVSYSYKEKAAEDSAYSETPPTAAGEYTVKAAIAETANYNGGEATADFTIAEAGWTVNQYPDQYANQYTVTFEANGGTGSMDVQTVLDQVATALAENTYSRTDYTFAGWNTEADDTGTPYTDGASVALSGDLTLYAQWTAKQLYGILLCVFLFG